MAGDVDRQRMTAGDQETKQLIPPEGVECKHINFPEHFIDPSVTPLIAEIQGAVEGESGVKDLVLNFEKCLWFELLPTVQLVAVLLMHLSASPKLHIVGPCPIVLPYLRVFVSDLKSRLLNELDETKRAALAQRISRLEITSPDRRARAGAFLLGWGVFDALEEHYSNCAWYVTRDQRVSLAELRRAYPFGFGAGTKSTATASDRVMAVSVVYRDGEAETVSRVNSEEIVAGPLRKFSSSAEIADGSLQNVLFFEPFENVFTHAYEPQSTKDTAVFAMRLVNWMRKPTGELNKQAEWLLDKLDPSFAKFVRDIPFKNFIEIVIGDAGRGIPDALRAAFQAASTPPSSIDAADHDWQAIRFAFDKQSTSRPDNPAGFRGLSWVRNQLVRRNGFVQVISNRGSYTLAAIEGELQECGVPLESLQKAKKKKKKQPERSWVRGTVVRIVVPLSSEGVHKTIDRRPLWHEDIHVADLLDTDPTFEVWSFNQFQNSCETAPWDALELFAAKPNHFAVIDLEDEQPTRHNLELLFRNVLDREALHNRVIVINAGRHVVCRLDTILEASRFRDVGVLLPIFETGMRPYWLGTSPDDTELLIRLLRGGTTTSSIGDRVTINIDNPLFRSHDGRGLGLRFRIADIERCARSALGRMLHRSLDSRGAVNSKGRYVLPLSRKATSVYVEPHQIFADTILASRLCNHLAILLRWKYAQSAVSRMKVLTATRIGRDISIRMPEAYPEERFVYYDYHRIKPVRHSLQQYLAGEQAVIVVDVVTVGALIEELIAECEQAECTVLGIVSLIDFSPGSTSDSRHFQSRSGSRIEHLTFWRHPAIVTESSPSDIYVDRDTLSIEPTTQRRPLHSASAAHIHGLAALRFLDDAGVLFRGHYAVFGHHFEYVVDVPRLLTVPSVYREELLRATEQAILRHRSDTETAIVLYPSLGSAHLLRAALERRPQLRNRILRNDLRFIEARQTLSSRGRVYWLTDREVEELNDWATNKYSDGYSVVVIDDGACSGSTLIALLDLAKLLKPSKIGAFVVVNRMSAAQAAYHHEIEKFVWASADFGSFIHLDLPTYSSDNCPLCKERAELLREHKSAKTAWHIRNIEKGLDDLESQSAISTHQYDSPLRHEVHERFRWESEATFPAASASYAARAAAAWGAMNDGTGVLKILEDVSALADDELWRMIVVDVARRTDLQQAQRLEAVLARKLIHAVNTASQQRRAAALQALRRIRPEILFPYLHDLIRAAKFESETEVSELILLLRHAFSYGRLAGEETFEKEIAAIKLLDSRSAADPSIALRINSVLIELDRGRRPIFDCLSVVRKLERILKTHRRKEHSFLYVISEYLSDRRSDTSKSVLAAVDEAIAIGFMAHMLVENLLPTRRPAGSEVDVAASAITSTAREMATVLNRRKQKVNRISLRDNIDDIQEALKPISEEIQRLYVDLGDLVRNAMENAWWLSCSPDDRSLVDVQVDVPVTPLFVVIDRSLGRDIVHNVFWNLRHAINPGDRRLVANISVRIDGEDVELLVQCKTFDPSVMDDRPDTTSEDLSAQARLFGIRRTVVQRHPWHESWKFGRLL